MPWRGRIADATSWGSSTTHQSIMQNVLPLGICAAGIRGVDVGPDGHVYVLTDEDDGDIWVLKPLQ